MTYPVGSITGFIRVAGAAQAQRDILGVQRSMTLTGETAGKAAAGIGRTETAMGGLSGASSRASSASAKFRAAQLSSVAATERYNTVLMDENATLRQLATAEAGVIRANERLRASQVTAASSTRTMSTEASASAGAMSRAGTAIGGFARTAAGLGLALGGFELVKKAIDIGKEASQFQQSMLLIQTNANASAAEVKNMTDAVLTLSPEVATKPNDLAQALYHVEQNGLRGSQALEALKVGAEGAKIGMADVEDTTNTMTIALASGIKGMGTMQQTMGFMIATAGTGDMRLKDLNEALSGGILSVAKGFGATMGDVAAILATLGDNGIRGADAATAIRQTLMGFAKPAKEGKDALAGIGLSMTSLRDDMEKHGLVHAMNDLEKHMTSAGVTGSKVGGFITTAFGRKAGAGISVLMGEIDRLNIKFDEGLKGAASFGDKWAATTKTTAFAFQKLGAEFEVAGIKLADKVLPAGAAVGNMLATGLPAGLTLVGNALHPFVTGFEAVAPILVAVGHGLSDVAQFLAPVAPVLEKVGSAALGVWVAFKGYEIARYAASVVAEFFAAAQAKAVAGVASIRAYGAGVSATMDDVAGVSVATGQVMQAEFAKIEAAAMKQAAAMDRAAAADAEAYATMVAASDDASATMIANSANVALAASRQAEASTLAATTTATAAEEAAAVVVESGETAAIGWAGVLGPLAAVGLGIGLLVSMFHKSDTASKEAAAAAKAYTDALQSDSPRANIIDAITKQLSDNDVPAKIDAINKAYKDSGLQAQLSGTEFVRALESQGKPLDDLRGKLEKLIKTGTFKQTQGYQVTPAAQAAQKLLDDLNSQLDGMSAAAKKELSTLHELGTAAEPIGKVAQQLHLGSDAAASYAAMLGLAVTKDGNLIDSTKANIDAIAAVSRAFDTATQSGSDMLAAMQAFSKSGATAADRAALIGATLKAANGDALNFAASINAAAVADKQLVTDMASAAKSVGKNGESVGALMDSIVNLKKGTIDYTNTAAAPLISGLQSMQDAAMKAAEAEFQHARSYTNGKNAADAAYKVYVNQTRGALIDEHKKLGLTATQAGKLADQYFGMPSKVKTLIEAEGTDPIITVLNKIGTQLAYLTGHPWVTKPKVDPTPAQAGIKTIQDRIDAIRQGKVPGLTANSNAGRAVIAELQAEIDALRGKTVYVNVINQQSGNLGVKANAAGGSVPEGYSTVGEGGAGARPELLYKSGPHVRVFSHSASKAIVSATGLNAPGMVPGFASGTSGNDVVTRTVAGPYWSGLSGIADMLRKQIPGSAQAMSMLSDALNRAFTLEGVQRQLASAKTALADMSQRVSDLRSGVTSALTSAFDPTKYGSVTDLLGGLSGATGANKSYAADVAHAGKLGLSTTFLRQLEASGNTATLDALGHASAAQIAQVNKAYLGYSSSIAGGADAAVAASGLAGPLAADQARVAQMERQQASLLGGIDKLLLGISRLTGQKAEITLDGKTIAEAVIHSREMIGVIDELGHHGLYGRR